MIRSAQYELQLHVLAGNRARFDTAATIRLLQYQMVQANALFLEDSFKGYRALSKQGNNAGTLRPRLIENRSQ